MDAFEKGYLVMTRTVRHRGGAILGLAVSIVASLGTPGSAGPKPTENPDFTAGGSVPQGSDHDWNLGATGARGWMFSSHEVTTDARQVYITRVEENSPAHGVLAVGDVLLGVAGKRFSHDPRTEIGKALTLAESEAGRGDLSLVRWRSGATEEVLVKLPVLGTYSATAPFECPKSRRILEQGCRTLAQRMRDPNYDPDPIPRSLNALALLASGEDQYLPLVKKEAHLAAERMLNGGGTWHHSYVLLLVSEYALGSGDESILPALQKLAMRAAEGQSAYGAWGHGFADPKGRLGGYGMMHSPSIPMTIGMVLARQAGVRELKLDRAIELSAAMSRFYVGKGGVPYGDHHPWIESHDDNGKNGMAAVLFNLLGEKPTAEYYSRMSLASHGGERDLGHTGNFFNVLWAMPGLSLSGEHACGAWMAEFGGWYFDLARRWDGSFVHLGPPGLQRDAYASWDCTGVYLLAYALPLRNLYLTGKAKSVVPPLDAPAASRVIADGRGWDNKDRFSAYDKLSTEELFERLSSWSPVVRERAGIALGRRQDEVVPRLIALLDSPDLNTRDGACRAIRLQGQRGEPAVPALIKTLESDELWLRVLAVDALAGIGAPARSAAPIMLERLAQLTPEQDPRNMEQRYLSFALFNRRGGLLGGSLQGIDRELLYRAVRAGLTNQNGQARGSFASVYENLTFEELKPLLPDVLRAIVEPAPSGEMFNEEIRMAGLKLLAEHRVRPGMELLARHAREQKLHGSEHRAVELMEMLKRYGSHARTVIPELEANAVFFEQDVRDGHPRHLSLEKAKLMRQTIQAIRASTDNPELRELES